MGGTVKKAMGAAVSSGAVKEVVEPKPVQASRAEDETAATLRARRRGARALLSDSRLNPETGLGQTTLGSGPMM